MAATGQVAAILISETGPEPGVLINHKASARRDFSWCGFTLDDDYEKLCYYGRSACRKTFVAFLRDSIHLAAGDRVEELSRPHIQCRAIQLVNINENGDILRSFILDLGDPISSAGVRN
jgi:hypothetical protein